jgi:hypothetical protein
MPKAKERPLSRRVLLLAAGAVVALALALGGLLAANGGGGPSHRAEFDDKLDQRWVVELVARPDQARPGSPIEVTIGIANKTGKPQTISFPTNNQVQLQAKDEDGKVVWRSEEPSVKVDLSRSIGAEPTEFTRTWSTAGLGEGEYIVEGAILAQELEGKGRVSTAVVLR